MGRFTLHPCGCHGRNKKIMLPMAPPIYEVILKTSMSSKHRFKSSAHTKETAFTEAYKHVRRYLFQHAMLCIELKTL